VRHHLIIPTFSNRWQIWATYDLLAPKIAAQGQGTRMGQEPRRVERLEKENI
jgi:hypothetical protein